MANETISQYELKRLFHYNPATGELTRKSTNRLVGSPDKEGYLRIIFKKREYRVHRLAFLYMKGAFPPDEVDHINHIRSDNRWSNLRHATRKENCRNLSRSSLNTSGISGVHWYTSKQIWIARIKVNYERIYLGCSKSLLDAAALRKSAEIKYGFHPNHGRSI